ncbi:DUF3519 domain-containing protein [Helicobacter pylori]|nr:DUF3519 domain-containing protein [Helicobacter pylori]
MRTRARLGNKWVVSSYEIYNNESESPFLLMTQLQGVGLGTPKLAEPNPTPKPLNSQEDLLKNTENLNETTQEVKNLSPLAQMRV